MEDTCSLYLVAFGLETQLCPFAHLAPLFLFLFLLFDPLEPSPSPPRPFLPNPLLATSIFLPIVQNFKMLLNSPATRNYKLQTYNNRQQRIIMLVSLAWLCCVRIMESATTCSVCPVAVLPLFPPCNFTFSTSLWGKLRSFAISTCQKYLVDTLP